MTQTYAPDTLHHTSPPPPHTFLPDILHIDTPIPLSLPTHTHTYDSLPAEDVRVETDPVLRHVETPVNEYVFLHCT